MKEEAIKILEVATWCQDHNRKLTLLQSIEILKGRGGNKFKINQELYGSLKKTNQDSLRYLYIIMIADSVLFS
jgi:hypothetical protein